MKINFEQLKVYKNIAKTEEMILNAKVEIADGIYQNVYGVAAHALALKIYNSTGDCELTDEEYQILMAFVEQKCTPMVIEAFKNAALDENN